MDKGRIGLICITVIAGIALNVLVIGADDWFGTSFGMFRWVIMGCVIGVMTGVVRTLAEKRAKISRQGR